MHGLPEHLQTLRARGTLSERAQPSQHCIEVIALGFGLELHAQSPPVEAGVLAIHPNEGAHVRHRRVLQQGLAQGLLALGHGRERDGLLGLGEALHQARVLPREKTFGHPHIQSHGERHGEAKHPQGGARAVQHPVQSAAIGGDPGREPIGGAGVVAHLLALAPQPMRTQHGGERERHHGRNEDGHRQGDGELVKQAPGHAAHEQERNQHRHQGEGERNDGEADLPGPIHGRLNGAALRVIALVPGNVLDHHDGVVHHKPRGNREGHEGEVVDGKARQIHHAKGAHQRQGHHHRGNGGGGQVAQKQKDDPDHQGHGQHQLELHVAHRGANRVGAVTHHLKVHRFGHGRTQLRQQLVNALHGVNDVGTRLALDVEQHGRLAIGPGSSPGVFRGLHHIGHIAQAQGVAVFVGQDQLGIVLRRLQLIVGIQRRGAIGAIESALGQIDIGAGNRGAHVLEGEARGGQRLGVDLHAHRGAPSPGDAHQTHPLHLRQAQSQAVFHQVVDPGDGQGGRTQRQGQHRRIGRVDLVVNRRHGHVAGQEVRARVDGRLHPLLGHIQCRVQ